ncbi:DUF86 domain-containing protein [Crocosphaera sp.]|uniref:HepT-like ribonuclease domain-containing protein n=1 Tax=Crocosphaera sp. TaxID=2729996 RepID=UPI0026209F12|nr:DUF86 domain-containing protein [Crocosphaera sp.]MDJ0578520.1 DUF86 domain-containing protein [Crocosphaera sp.]
MSSNTPRREWRFYVDDMILFAEKVQRYTQNFDQKSFINSEPYYDATLRNLELIGEAATNIPQEIKTNHPEIPWRQIIATRNRIIHGYLGIDNEIIWSIITEDIPSLITDLKNLKDSSKYPN